MAIIYSYPLTTNILATDVIVGTTTTLAGGRPRNQTKSFEIGDLATYFASVIAPPGTYVPYNGATGPVNLGAYDLTLNGATIGRGGGQIYSNIVFGLSSLLNNTTGQNNTYFGFSSGYYNTIGSYNTAIGAFASQFTTTGSSNTTIGNYALYTNTTGSNNLAIGYGALFTNTTGSGNIAIGYQTRALNPTDVNSIIIGTSATGAGSNTVVLGNTSITTTRLRGAVQGGSFVKDSGTSFQHLMADGSIITNGPLFSSSSIVYPIVSGSTQFYSSAISSNIFSNGNAIRIYTITTTTTTSVANVQTEYYVNSSPSMTGAVRLANYSGTLGNRYYPMDRTLWINGGNFNGRNDNNSSSTSQGSSNSAPSSNAIPATQFYIIVQITTTSTDLATLSSLTIEKL